MASSRVSLLGLRGVQTQAQPRTRRLIWPRFVLRRQRIEDRPLPTNEAAAPRYFEDLARQLPLNTKYLTRLSELWTSRAAVRKDRALRKDDRLVDAGTTANLPPIPDDALRLGFDAIPGAKSASESVRKLLSVQYGVRKDRQAIWEAQILSSVRSHRLDVDSLPAQIGSLTFRIRDMSSLVAETAVHSPKRPRWLLERLERAIAKRRDLMRLLRERDAATATAVEERLGLDFSAPPHPLDDGGEPESRFDWVRAQVERRVEEEKAARLEAYRRDVEAQREDFLQRKAKRMGEIRAKLAELKQSLAEMDEADPAPPKETVGRYEPSSVDTNMLKTRIHRQFYNMEGERI